MFRIGEFSKISQVSMRSLRHYDEIGLFKPGQIDRMTGYRFYSADQLPRLNRILALKDLGLSLEQVAQVLNDNLPASEIRGMLRLKQAELQQHVSEEQARLGRVEARLKQIELEGTMPDYEAVLRKVEAQKIVSIREIAPNLTEMGILLTETYTAMQHSGLKNLEPGLAIFYDPQYEDEQVDWEVGFPVSDGFKGSISLARGRQMTVRELPGIEQVATVIYRGDYVGLHRGYSALGTWIEANSYRITGIGREVFLRIDLEDQERCVTEIQFPVERVGISER